MNRKTISLPKYDPQKRYLPKRSDYAGALSWLKAVRECLGESVVFALDEALMCQGSFGGRSNEYVVWVYGDDSWSAAERKESNTMKIKLDYVRVGDYYLPDLTAEPYPDRGLGKYGLLRLRYLKEHRPIVWAEYVMEGKLYAHLLEVEDAA